MNGNNLIDLVSANRVRANPKQKSQVGTLSSLIGLWVLLPLAMSGLCFVGVYIVFELFLSDLSNEGLGQMFFIVWYLLSLFSQTIYWMWIAQSTGINVFQGLWSLVPFIGWVKTFQFSYLLVQKTGSASPAVGMQGAGPNVIELDVEPKGEANEQNLVDRPEDLRPTGEQRRTKTLPLLDTHSTKLHSEYKKKGINTLKVLTRSFASGFRVLATQVSKATLKLSKVLRSDKKWVAVGVGTLVVFAFGFLVARPIYFDYQAKNSANQLVIELQEVMDTSKQRPLDFTRYSRQLNPSLDNFLGAGSNAWKTATSNCSTKLYDDLRFTIGELRSENYFNLYPETIIGLLNQYVKSCE
jgi:hypothetical protein